MTHISSLKARQILDSRGNPTVEVDCTLDDGSFGRAAVPSGASTGSLEALELRDGGASYCGKAVGKAVENVAEIAEHLAGKSVSDHRTLDQNMIDLDGTDNKGRLGANAILGVSMAVCRARAASENVSLYTSLAMQFDVSLGDSVKLPVPMMNVINGGKHADSGLSFQECMVIPTDFSSFSEALRAGTEVFHALKKILKTSGHITAVGDEGGFAPHLSGSDEAFSILGQAIEQAGYSGQMKLAIDAAASEFYEEGQYNIDGKTVSSTDLVSIYEGLCSSHPIVSIEDSHHEQDWDGFAAMQASLGSSIQLVGDDLLVTNTSRMREAMEKNAANAVLIKLNQIGTVSETVDAISLAHESSWNAVVSHRSGETEDTFIADLSVALQTGQIKTGSLSRTDRLCKYNQLLRIEEELGERAVYGSPF